jgi:glucose-6-phosphate 1-dehydrogenase
MQTNDQLEPTVFVIFGGAGDLFWRKLVPALFDLSRDRSMPVDFSIIAVDRVDLSDEKLRQRLHAGVKRFSRQGNVYCQGTLDVHFVSPVPVRTVERQSPSGSRGLPGLAAKL